MARRTKTATTFSTSRTGSNWSALDAQAILCGDNLDQMSRMPAGFCDLVYIDPPFNSNRNYEVFWGEHNEARAFEDRHESTRAYLEFMRPRCEQVHRILKDTGSFYFHCDWHASHYVKVMLDQIFGENAFRNEIIWKRQSAHNDSAQGSKHYGRLHDTIFFYTKSPRHTWNQQFEKYSEQYIETFYANIEPETGRRFQYGDLTGPGGAAKGNPQYEFLGVTRYWRYSQAKMEELHRQGRIEFRPNGKVPRLKRYLDEAKGMPVQSVWTDIRPLSNFGKEAVGYPTQKPLGLLERIIQTSSNPEDIVLDAFCGCGTALVAAQRLGRRWVGIDVSPSACKVMADRLEEICGLRRNHDFAVLDMPHTIEFLRELPPFEFESWAVLALGGTPNNTKVGDLGIDGRLFFAEKTPSESKTLLGLMDRWYPIQVKQKDKAGSPDIRDFAGVMAREQKQKGFFVSFDYTLDAEREVRSFFKSTGMEIVTLKVQDIIRDEYPLGLR